MLINATAAALLQPETGARTMSAPSVYAVALFPGFQLLDVAGPLDILNLLKRDRPNLKLYILSSTAEPVPTFLDSAFSQSIAPTHTFDDCPEDVEVLLIPGGIGVRDDNLVKEARAFAKRIYPKLAYVITVCTGSALLAKTGILDGKKATSNKASFEWVRSTGPNVEWVPQARWVVDGNIWTSSGISAGMDVTYAFVEEMYSKEEAQLIADRSEYIRNQEAAYDPFAKRWDAK